VLFYCQCKFGKKLLRAYVVLFYYVPNQNKVFLSYLILPMFLYIIILCIFNSMLSYTYYIISLRMLIHILNYCIREKLHMLEKLVSDPYLLCLANKK
jgi:hypothetical protein